MEGFESRKLYFFGFLLTAPYIADKVLKYAGRHDIKPVGTVYFAMGAVLLWPLSTAACLLSGESDEK